MELKKCECVTTEWVTDEWGQLGAEVSYDPMAGRMQAFLSAQNILDKVVKPTTTGELPLGGTSMEHACRWA